MNWYLKVMRDNYANFSGRARRKEYWIFYLFQLLIFFGLVFLGGAFSYDDDSTSIPLAILGLYMLGTFIPFLAVTVRRLHDTGKSGWWILSAFIPYVGKLLMIIFCASEGDVGPNKYGKDPKNSYDEINDIGNSLE